MAFLIAQTSIWNETALPDGEEEIKSLEPLLPQPADFRRVKGG
jgi:hypothetical protein